MNDIYEKAIKKLELARRLSLGPNYTTPEEKKINPNDKLIIRALKEKYQDIRDPEAWSKFGAKLIVSAQKELKLVNDKIAGQAPMTASETTQSLQTWKTELEGILSTGSQDAFRKLTTLAVSGDRGITEIPPAVLKETEREELVRLRTESKEFLDKIRDLPPSDKKVTSFADALDKLEKVAKKLTPQMVDVGTQTEPLYVLSTSEKNELDKVIADYQDKVTKFPEEIKAVKDELEKTQKELTIAVEAREDAIIHNQNLQQLYTSETKDLRNTIDSLNKDIVNYNKSLEQKQQETSQLQSDIANLKGQIGKLAGKGNETEEQLSQLQKQLTEKTQELERLSRTKEQELNIIKVEAKVTREKLDAIQNVRKVSVEIQAKPEMKDSWVQTKLTAEQITQMEQSITKYQADIQTEQAKASQLTNQINTLQGEIRDLQEQVKDKEKNESEKQLVAVLNLIGIGASPAFYGRTEEEIKAIHSYLIYGASDGSTTLFPLGISTNWNLLRGEYQNIRYKLQMLCTNRNEIKNLKSKITRLEKDKGELQTKYDMEVRSKEELVKFLNYYRNGPLYINSVGSWLYHKPKELTIDEIVEQHQNYFYLIIEDVNQPTNIRIDPKRFNYNWFKLVVVSSFYQTNNPSFNNNKQTINVYCQKGSFNQELNFSSVDMNNPNSGSMKSCILRDSKNYSTLNQVNFLDYL